MEELRGKNVTVLDGKLKRKEELNRFYLKELKNWQLLRSFQYEAGRISGRGLNEEALGGWEDLSCQLRGHFFGHYLSACALVYEENGDPELYGKVVALLEELYACQQDNGGEWACSIPEKYLYWIGKGKAVWAPQYTIHKLFMGLIDVYRYMKLERALEIADKLADWFHRWSGEYTREEFDNILDTETGGMLEVWADLYEITGKEKYVDLINRYYRSRLFDALLAGRDVLTNMHANTTIPEIMGCARVYEVLGDEKYLDIVKAYWRQAVTERGAFATGGQTQGEIWTPKMRLKARLGDKNQEHCTVVNMIRLADFLFKLTKDPEYASYIEYNICNGVLAQTYFEGESYKGSDTFGLLTYFLPMKAGLKKDWAGKYDSFFCCHGTMIQANAAWNRHIYYVDGRNVYITQYINSEANFEIDGHPVKISIREDKFNSSEVTSSVNDGKQVLDSQNTIYANKPDFKKYDISVECDENSDIKIYVRVPKWTVKGQGKLYVDGQCVAAMQDESKFFEITEKVSGRKLSLVFPTKLEFVPLPDDSSVGAFRLGPDVLCGVTESERVLKIKGDDPTAELSMDRERQWGDFLTFYKTETQDPGITFKRINEIGYEPYQMYFKVIKE